MQSHPLSSSSLNKSPVGRSAARRRCSKPNDGSAKPVVPPPFDGTIASAYESMGISLDRMIEMMRWARESDPRVAQFLGTWDALDPSERQVWGTVEAVRQRAGLKPLELLGIVAEVACRLAMYTVQMIAALSHPLVVEKTIDLALDDFAKAKDRLGAQIVLHKATGFLPTPRGSQTIFSVTMQNAQANAAVQAPTVTLPPPEDTIRRLAERFNEARGLPRTPPPALPESAIGQSFPGRVPEDEEGDGE